MPEIRTVERNIHAVEGFHVRILHPSGEDVHGKKRIGENYTYKRAADKAWTVREWKQARFKTKLAGFDCKILDGEGNPVNGSKKLKNLRSSYTK